MTTSLLQDARRGFAAFLLGSALLATGCSSSPQAQGNKPAATPGGSVVATVNNENIDQAELDQELNRLHGQEVLQTLIDDHLITQYAKKELKTPIDEKELKVKLDEIKKTPQYAAMLKAKNMTDADIEKYMRRLMQLKALILLEVPETEKLKAYDQFKEQLEQAHIYDILVDKKEDADKIVEQLKQGKDFEQMAKENSKDEASKDRGGDLGWVPRSAPLDPAFAKLAFTIPLNEVAGPVQVKHPGAKEGEAGQSSWAILKVTGRKKTYEEVKSDIEDRLVGMRQGDFMRRLRLRADIKTRFDAANKPASDASGKPDAGKAETGKPAEASPAAGGK